METQGNWPLRVAIIATLVLCAIGSGFVIGINIPDQTYCYSEDALCWHLRFMDKEILKEGQQWRN